MNERGSPSIARFITLCGNGWILKFFLKIVLQGSPLNSCIWTLLYLRRHGNLAIVIQMKALKTKIKCGPTINCLELEILRR